jgi:hypothetical protein
MPEGWTNVTEGYIEELYGTIEKQKGQLALALSILATLGFDIAEMVDTFMLQ